MRVSGCLNCVTACPSGVQYAPLIERTRAQIERDVHARTRRPAVPKRAARADPVSGRMRLACCRWRSSGRFSGDRPRAVLRSAARRSRPRPSARLEPDSCVAGAGAAGVAGRAVRAHAEHTPAVGTRRQKVGVLTGCVQRLAFDDVNRATVRVLAAEGCSVSAPADRAAAARWRCMRARSSRRAAGPAQHRGVREGRRRSHRRQRRRLRVGDEGYGDLFADDPQWAPRATAFSARVRDVSEMLVELGEPRAPRHPIQARVVYHDACHLAHGQGIRRSRGRCCRRSRESSWSRRRGGDLLRQRRHLQPGAARAGGAARRAQGGEHRRRGAGPDCDRQSRLHSSDRGGGPRMGHDWPIFHPVQLIDASIRGVTLGS